LKQATKYLEKSDSLCQQEHREMRFSRKMNAGNALFKSFSNFVLPYNFQNTENEVLKAKVSSVFINVTNIH
jgi:hypothetical protein